MPFARAAAVPMAVTALLLAMLLAGCAGSPSKPAGDAAGADVADPAAAGAPAKVGAAASTPAPTWKVGQWWEWEVSFGTSTRDETSCSIVVAVDGSSYTLATEKTWWAKDEATFGVPFLGTIAKPDLSMVGWGDGATAWTLLSFPLTDGKTWTATMPNIAWDVIHDGTVPLDMVATYDDAIGKLGGYHLKGSNEGRTIMEGEYDVRTGWYSGFRLYDIDPGQEELEVGFRAKSAGFNYTGPYFQHTAKPLVLIDDNVGFSADPTQGGQPYTQAPQPYAAFTMGEGTTLYGFLEATAVVGARAIVLVDPANNQRNVPTYGQLDGGNAFLPIDEPGKKGDWRVATAGAGGFSGAFIALYEVTEGNYSM